MYVLSLQGGYALCGAYVEGYSVFRFNRASAGRLAVLALADDCGVGQEVLLQDVQVSVTLLIQRVQADVGVHLAYAVLLDLLLAHVQQVEHLHLLRLDFVAKGDIELDMCSFGKPQHAQIVAAEDVMALHPIDENAEDVLLLGVR